MALICIFSSRPRFLFFQLVSNGCAVCTGIYNYISCYQKKSNLCHLALITSSVSGRNLNGQGRRVPARENYSAPVLTRASEERGVYRYLKANLWSSVRRNCIAAHALMISCNNLHNMALGGKDNYASSPGS